MSQVQKTAEQVVIETKAKLFDAIEANQALGQQVQELSGALQAIAQAVQIQPGETGTVQLTDIVAAVEALVPVEDFDAT